MGKREKKEKEKKCTILKFDSLLSPNSCHWSKSQGAGSGRLTGWCETMVLWALAFLGSSDGKLQLLPEHVPDLGQVPMMFLLLCPHIWTNGLDSGANCFPGNVYPTLS